MSKALKVYTVRHKDNQITLETDQSQNVSFMILLRLLFRHLYKKRPELLAQYVQMVNASFNACREKQTDEPEDDSYDFYKKLMEQPQN